MENRNKTFELYLKKLNEYGVSEASCTMLYEKYGNKIANASYSLKNDANLAYIGSMVKMSFKIASYAVCINNLFPENVRCDTKSIIKVALLQHISKGVRTKFNDNGWRRENLKEIFTYVDKMPAIGFGLHSVQIANECGIVFTPEEVEAMVCLDNQDSNMTKYHSSVLTSVISQANNMILVEANKVSNLIN